MTSRPGLVTNAIATTVATSRHLKTSVNKRIAGIAGTPLNKAFFFIIPGADSAGYIIYNTLDVATGGDCGGDQVFDRPPLARLRFS